ncbi:aminotransferase class V-fold PLP-dependent enzyme [Streptomyces sp. NPDC090131]|uniref:aminotransferase class V-fold PLP-dependent enzyme n=1 Tax=Streptomyces sp. NPDC090131 TaxID=3365954 RepID=UPI00380AC1EC
MNAPTHHGERTAHLDTAGTGRMPEAVRTVLARCTALDDRLGTAALQESLGDVLHTRIHERLGALLSVPAADTFLATGAAQAFETYLHGITLGPGDRIWTTPHEGVANLTALHALRDRTRCRLEVVPLRPDGDLDLDWMRTHLDEDVALVSAVHLSPACGTVNPVHDIGRLLAPHRARYTVDASHSAGRLPVDAARIGCHLLTADGWRFLRGPHNTGFAYIAPTPHPAPHPAPDGAPYRPAAPEPAAVAALDTALAHHTATARLPHEDLLPLLRAAVRHTPGMELLAGGQEQAAILAFRHAQIPAAAIRQGLARRGVVLAKTVAHETPLHPAGRVTAPALRASLHHDNTAQDIDRFRQALAEVLLEERRAAAHPARGALAAAGAATTPLGPAGQAGPSSSGAPSPYRARPVRRRGHLTLHRAT